MLHNNYTILEGGLHVKVLPLKHDEARWPTFSRALRSFIEYEAKSHNSNFDQSAFFKVVESIKADLVQAWVLLAGWDSDNLKVIGSVVEFPTVHSCWDGNDFSHYHAIYMEDLALPMFVMKELVRERPSGLSFPQQFNFSTYFVNEIYNIRLEKNPAPSSFTPVCRICEFSHLNAKMNKLLEDWGSQVGNERDGTIVEVKSPLQDNPVQREIPVKVKNILPDKYNTAQLPYVFLVAWENPDSKQKIVASFTKGISTFTGKTIIRTQVTSNGNIPDNDALIYIMQSILTAGQKEAAHRHWGMAEHKQPCRVEISLKGNQKKAPDSLLSSNDRELLSQKPNYPDKEQMTCDVFPTIQIHALGEPQIVSALKGILQNRVLGTHAMLTTKHFFPGSNELKTPFYIK